jgi:sodium-dependent dicarboxylate transporter 2/3/5
VGAAARLLACVAPAALAWWLVPQPDSVRLGVALFVLVGALWVTQALHVTVTALAVPLLAVLAGLMSPREALASFAHPTIFLFLGGFALAAALARQGLDRALAAAVLRAAGGRPMLAVLMLGALSALLSMWMSNTATAAMMVPLALGLLRGGSPAAPATAVSTVAPDSPDPSGAPATPAAPGSPGPREYAFVLLVVAYSATIGGMGTLIGSPPNAIAAAQAGIGFAQWLRVGIPTVLVMWPLMVGVLALVLRPRLSGRVAPPAAGPAWRRDQVVTIAIFALTVAGWIGGAPLAAALGIAADVDTVVALAALVALAATGALGWPDMEQRTQWGVLLLFGGGIALSEAMARSGASRYLTEAMLGLVQGAPPVLLVLGLVLFLVFLTELVSNTAAAALTLPVFLPVAAAIGFEPHSLAIAIALAASCGFMLPVGTPPNAIAYATEAVPLRTMMWCGLWLDLACAGAITALAVTFWR